MKKIVEDKPIEYYAFTKEEAEYLRKLMGAMNDEDKARLLKVPLNDPILQFGFDLFVNLKNELQKE